MIEPVVSLAEAQAFLRLESADEEALVAGLARSATALCEAFVGKVLITRSFEVQIAAKDHWQRLSVCPVWNIVQVIAVGADGSEMLLLPDAYAIDIDMAGEAWVRLTRSTESRRLKIIGNAGTATSSSDVPEPIRQGVLRLVAHLFNERDGAGGEPPAAVTALWRPYRRTRLT
jgi:uncharacterized phiE125 gp8 family phage protein